MKRSHPDGKLHTIRLVHRRPVWLAAHRAVLGPVLAILLIVLGLFIGYLAGRTDPDEAYALSEAAGLSQLKISRAAEDDRIQTVEQINREPHLIPKRTAQ
jgi:hypothetical protein